MNTRKSIFFSQSSVRIQLHDTKGVKKRLKNRKSTQASMKPRRFIFFSSFQPVFEYKILRTKRAMKKQEIDDVFDEHKEIYFFLQTSVRIQLYKQLGYNTYLKLLRLPLLGGQPSRLTNSFVEYYRFDSLMSQLYIQLGYKTYLKLPKLKISKTLHNLYYVTSFFVISLSDGIFDAFNCWNHSILQVLCIRHGHIFSCATADWCIQIVKCF